MLLHYAWDVRTVRAWWLGWVLLTTSCAAHAPSNEAACRSLSAEVSGGPQRLVYLKSEHVLCLFEAHQLVWQGSASHGSEAGKKQFEGDERTPEGRYTVAPARESPRFGRYLHISYPRAEDRRVARRAHKHPGSAVGVHGPQRWYAFLGSAQSLVDHSDGCIVVDAEGIGELSRRIKKTISFEILAKPP